MQWCHVCSPGSQNEARKLVSWQELAFPPKPCVVWGTEPGQSTSLQASVRWYIRNSVPTVLWQGTQSHRVTAGLSPVTCFYSFENSSLDFETNQTLHEIILGYWCGEHGARLFYSRRFLSGLIVSDESTWIISTFHFSAALCGDSKPPCHGCTLQGKRQAAVKNTSAIFYKSNTQQPISAAGELLCNLENPVVGLEQIAQG